MPRPVTWLPTAARAAAAHPRQRRRRSVHRHPVPLPRRGSRLPDSWTPIHAGRQGCWSPNWRTALWKGRAEAGQPGGVPVRPPQHRRMRHYPAGHRRRAFHPAARPGWSWRRPCASCGWRPIPRRTEPLGPRCLQPSADAARPRACGSRSARVSRCWGCCGSGKAAPRSASGRPAGSRRSPSAASSDSHPSARWPPAPRAAGPRSISSLFTLIRAVSLAAVRIVRQLPAGHTAGGCPDTAPPTAPCRGEDDVHGVEPQVLRHPGERRGDGSPQVTAVAGGQCR